MQKADIFAHAYVRSCGVYEIIPKNEESMP